MTNADLNPLEWLQSNKLGSFSLGSRDRLLRRKYSTLLTVREPPGCPEPINMLADVGETIKVLGHQFMLHSLAFSGAAFPVGHKHLAAFTDFPQPLWQYELDVDEEKLRVVRRLDFDHDQDVVRLIYEISGVKHPVEMSLEPLLLCRPWHKLTFENPFLNGAVKTKGVGEFAIKPYPETPELFFKVTGASSEFKEAGRWIKNIFYAIERERGYDCKEDCFSPGAIKVKFSGDSRFVLHIGTDDLKNSKTTSVMAGPVEFSKELLKLSAKTFLIQKKNRQAGVIAGYPWFEDWDRDTFISLPGLTLPFGDFDCAHKTLKDRAVALADSVLPHAPTVSGIAQNAMADAPLLFIRAVQLLESAAGERAVEDLIPFVFQILNGFKSRKDHRVSITDDGGFHIKPGPYASTWMDVVWNGQPLTPRNGFAVDLNALFYNALRYGLSWAEKVKNREFLTRWTTVSEKAQAAFLRRFWSEERGFLADTTDGHTSDLSLRPNQLWATALPYSPVSKAQGQRITKAVREQLLTPVGLRTLAPDDSRYQSFYRGGPYERDHAYHQGTVWPWLIGIYADSVLKFDGREVLKKDLTPVLERLRWHFTNEGCVGQISEVFDGAMPHLPGGTPAQAWSLAEYIRTIEVLNENSL